MIFQHNRILPLQSIRNCRELGGYYTADHRQVRWNSLVRSTDLHHLSSQDARYLWRYGIHTIVDFRSPEEMKSAPDRKLRGANYYHLPITETGWKRFLVVEDFTGKLFSGLLGQDGMHALYQSFINDERARSEFTRFFKVLLHRPNGILFHCVEGKDRTGFASALLLHLLGVPQEVIVQDYLLTNQNLSKSIRWIKKSKSVSKFFPLVTDTVENVFSVQAEYLYSAQQEAIRCYGSLDNYIRDGLGLSDTDRILLQNKFLRPIKRL